MAGLVGFVLLMGILDCAGMGELIGYSLASQKVGGSGEAGENTGSRGAWELWFSIRT